MGALDKALKFALSSRNDDGSWDGPIHPTLFQSALVAYAFKPFSSHKSWFDRAYGFVENYPVFKPIDNSFAKRYFLQHEWLFHEGARALLVEDKNRSKKIARVIKNFIKKKGNEKMVRKILILAVLFIQEGFLKWGDLPDSLIEKIKLVPIFSTELEKMPWRFVSYAAISAKYFYDKGDYEKTIFLVKKILKYLSSNGSWNEYPFITAFIASILNRLNVFIPDTEYYLVSRQFDSGGFAPISAVLWDTVFATNVLKKIKGASSFLGKSYSFLLSNRLPNNFWGWDVNGNMDFDTTSMAIHVLPYASVKKQRKFLVLNQKSDGSWGTWTKDDDSSVDVTAHCLTALGKNFSKSRLKAIEFLLNSNEHGAWFPSWYTNIYYGISQVVEALHANGFDSFEDSVSFIEKNQNKDGGWGELPGFESSAIATAHAVSSLIEMNEFDKAGEGVEWLKSNQLENGTWKKSRFAIGPYPLIYSDSTVIHFSVLTSLLKFYQYT